MPSLARLSTCHLPAQRLLCRSAQGVPWDVPACPRYLLPDPSEPRTHKHGISSGASDTVAVLLRIIRLAIPLPGCKLCGAGLPSSPPTPPGTGLAAASESSSAGRVAKDSTEALEPTRLPPWSPALSPAHGHRASGCMSQTLSGGPHSAPVPSAPLPSSVPPTGPREIIGAHFSDGEN